MIPRFEFATAARVLFGAGQITQAGQETRALASHALVITGRHPDRAAPLLQALGEAGVLAETFPIAGEPDLRTAQRGAERARALGSPAVIGFGGGSAIDAAKAIAALATNPDDVLEYLEVIGRARPLAQPPLPILAVPTTAGAGAETTRNAVLRSPEHRVKVSLRSPWLLPRLAIVDPSLTLTLPPEVTAATGMDALTQLIEPFLCNRSQPLVDALCREGMRRTARSLRRVVDDGRELAAREDMALASLAGGMALANAGLGAVHGFAAPVGGMFEAPHGAVCAALLPGAMEVNLGALLERMPESPIIPRFDEVAQMLTGAPDARARDGLAWIRETCRLVRIPGLAHWGIQAGDLPALIEKAAVASSMKANPIALTRSELHRIAEKALTDPGR